MSRPRLVCVTGGTGLVGKALEETLPADVRMVSAHLHPDRVRGSRARQVIVDVRDRRSVEKLFQRYTFDAVVHAAGIANVDYAETHYLDSWESNMVGTFNLVAAAQRAGCHLIHVSSNAVFDGTAAPYREDDPLRPINRYGAIKAECERLVRAMDGTWTIVRPILMYGWHHAQNRSNLVTWAVEALSRGQSLQMVTDVYENPLYSRQCSLALWAIVTRRLTGVFHVAGAEVLNRYDFARRVAEIFGLDGSLIHPVSSSFFPSIAPRPRNTSFVTERMERELGIAPLDVAAGLRAMHEQARNGR